MTDVFAARNITVEGNHVAGNHANGISFAGGLNTTIANNHVIGSPKPPTWASWSGQFSHQGREQRRQKQCLRIAA